jgi:hypothetical protein
MFDPSFFGKSPPNWFIGQVPLGQTINREDPNQWGDRVKIRIVGNHAAEGNKIKDEDLPWAIILRSTSHGALNRMSTGITGGEWVIGIFINKSYVKPIPLILGVLGRSDPTYNMTFSEAEKKKSSEFKKTLNWYNDIQPQLYHKFGNQTPGEKSSQSFPKPPSSFFGI